MSGIEDGDLAAAAAFGTVLQDEEDILTADMHAVIRLMYRQRFYLQTMPHLLQAFQTAPAATRRLHLIAVSHLLRHVPQQVLLPDLNKVWC